MANSSNLIMFGAVAVGGYFLYQWYTGQQLPSDAQYGLTVPIGTAITVPQSWASGASPVSGTATTALAYVYYSPSTKLTYISFTAPTQAQLAAVPMANTVPVTTSATTTTPVTSTPVSTTPAATGTMQGPPSNGGSLDSLYTQLKTSATGDTYFTGSGDALSGTPYHWQFYVNALKPGNTLDLTAVFPGVDLTQPMTAAQFWVGAGPALGAEYGLSGYRGLGMYAGLGDYMRTHGSPYGWRR